MTKTAAKTKTSTPPAESVGELITTSQLFPSPTNPRKRFPEASINELAASIKEQGIIEPLIVRETSPDKKVVFGAYEIVCGERRYRAARVAGVDPIPCIVRDLTDDQVLDIQIHENLHREDVHPMDEAYGYKFLQDKLSCSVAELSIRVGKAEKYILNRLKLNTLIDEAQADIEAGHLPLVYALEIAKYAPEAQKLILDQAAYQGESKYVKNNWVQVPIKGKMNEWSSFTTFIKKNILWQLTAAPFDLKATNLRADGLPCVSCPDRSGANASLFDGELVGKKDACLNPTCFRGKAEQHIVITRQRVAHESTVEVDAVPVINLEAYQDSKSAFGKHSFTVVGKKPYKSFYGTVSEKICDKSVTAVNISDGQYGKTYEVCLQRSGCKTHYPGVKAAPAKSGKAAEKEREAELDKKRQRREEIFDMRVSNIVRKQVFRLAAEKFAPEFLISQAGPDRFLVDLLTKLWITSNNGDDSTTIGSVVTPIMQEITDEPKGFQWSTWSAYREDDSQSDAGKAIATLSETNQKLLLFLLVHGNKGNTYCDSWRSQKEVKELATFYDINYQLLDAKARLQVAEEKAKKHVESFKLYLAAVETGQDGMIPRVWSVNWRPKD